MKMKGFAMKKIGETGWVEKDIPACGPLDAIVKPLAVAICTSDIHTIAGAIGDRKDMILGHEVCGEIHEVGSLVKDFKKGDRVLQLWRLHAGVIDIRRYPHGVHRDEQGADNRLLPGFLCL